MLWLFPYAAFVVYSTYFKVTPHGEISLASALSPRTTYFLTVYVTFTGIAVNGGTVSGRAFTRVRVSVKGQCTWAWDLLCESVEQMYPPSPTPLPTLPPPPTSLPPLGCRQEEGGGHVWPIIHPCGIATANCSDYDRAFSKYGIITRQCTREGGHD